MSKYFTNLRKIKTPNDICLNGTDTSWFMDQAEHIIRDKILPHFKFTEYKIESKKISTLQRTPKDTDLNLISHSQIYKQLSKRKKHQGVLKFKFKIPNHRGYSVKITLNVRIY